MKNPQIIKVLISLFLLTVFKICFSAPPVGEIISLQSVDESLFVNVDPSDADRLEANFAEDTDTAQHFLVEDAGGGNIRLISRSTGDYVVAGATGQNRLFANSTQSDPLAVFQWTDVATNIVRLTNVSLGNDVNHNGGQDALRASGNGTNQNYQWTWEIKSVNVPRIANTIYSDYDTPLYTINAVAEFGADNTGASDTTAEIQAAIDAAFEAHGGIVYLPSGNYLLQSPLVITKSVTLRGDWKRPTDSSKTVAGTVLYIDHGAGTGSLGDDVSAIQIATDAGIRDLSIYYPNQTLNNPNSPIEYPYTLEGVGTTSGVRNVTLVNSYRGIRYGNDSAAKFATVNNVFGSPIHRGLEVDNVSAATRAQNVRFAPEYWTQSGLGSVNRNNVVTAMRASDGAAFNVGNGPGGDIYVGLTADGYDIALRTFRGGGASRFFDLTFVNCRVGFDLSTSSGRPLLFTAGYVQAEETAVRLYNTFKNASFSNLTFLSDDVVVQHDTGSVNFTKCTFQDWGSGYAIESSNGFLITAGCTFVQSSSHINLQSGVDRVSIFGNTPNGSGLDILNNSSAAADQIVIDTTSPHLFAELDSLTYPFLKHDRLPTPPAGTDYVFNVMDYGAMGDAIADDTAAIQAALDAAGSLASASAGCIVHLPPGAYRIDGRLNVPSFIEFRGIHDTVFSKDSRSILAGFADQNDPSQPAMVTLAADSGISGITFYRPDQKWDSSKGITTLIPYPYAVQGTDRNWAYNIVFSNTYDSLDFRSGGGHHLDFIYTFGLNRTVDLGADGAPTILENFQGKLDSWKHARKYSLPAFVAAGWTDGAPSNKQDGGLAPIGIGPAAFGSGVFRYMGHFINATGDDLYQIFGSPTLNICIGGGEHERAGTPNTVGIKIDSSDPGTLDLEVIGCSWNLSGIGVTEGVTGAGDRLNFINNKAAADASLTHSISGSGRIVAQTDWRGGSTYQSNFKLDGDIVGIIEGSEFTSSHSIFIQALGNSQAKVCGSLFEKNPAVDDWIFDPTDESQIYFVGNAPDIIVGVTGNSGALGNIDSNAPSIPTGLTTVAGEGAVALDWADNSENDLALYGVFRSTSASGPYENIQDVLASEFTDYDVVDGTTYFYAITSIDHSANESALSAEVSAQPDTLTLILFDDFESGFGNWTDGGADCILNTSGGFVNGSAGVLNLQDDTSSSVATTGDLALSTYSEIFVEFDYEIVSIEASERFALDISTDGGVTYLTERVWVNNVDFVSDAGVYNNESALISGISLTDQTRIRLRCNAGNNGDDVYIDDIRILAR
ncbi:MAG: glycosyl hydrolase family 28-related protein [Verrucomicrobiota bacterium]